MFTALGDPYSQYLTSQEYKDSCAASPASSRDRRPDHHPLARRRTEVHTARPQCALVISSPLDGSPAKKAGIKAGDVAIAVDGKSLDGLTVDEART